MFTLVGIVGALILAVAVVWIFYIAGSRGRAQDKADRATMQRSENPAPRQTRAEGRGDL